MADLQPFEGVDVTGAKVEIPDAAGGLRDAMEVAPVELHHGDEGHIVLKYRVKKVRFDPPGGKREKGADVPHELVRVHVMETLEAAFIDDDIVQDFLNESVDKVRRAIEQAKGVQRLDDALDDADDAEHAAELVKAHDMGLHAAGVVVGCSACEQREADRKSEKKRGSGPRS